MQTTRRIFLFGALAVGAGAGSVWAAQDTEKVTHRVLAQDKGRAKIIGVDGKVEWDVPCPFVSHDIQYMRDGNVLLHTGAATVTEVNPKGETQWTYTSKPKAPYDGVVEVHAFRRLRDGNTMIAETGNKRIIEVDKDGKIVKEVPLTVEHPNSHRDTRMVRKTQDNHYLVCHEGDGCVREYDETGKVVWIYKLDLMGKPRTPNHDGHGTEVFGAIRLQNGNTMIAGGNNNRAFEVNPKGETVWSVEQTELPGVKLFWVTTLQMLPNGNLVIGNTHAGPDNPQLVEVTRDKKVVWTFKDWTNFGNDTVAAQVLGVQGRVIR